MLKTHEHFMALALAEARKAYALGEVPIGAVVVHNQTVIASAHNLSQSNHSPLAHAEMLAISKAMEVLGEKYLNQCTLYCTLEPCPMCTGAVMLSRLSACYFGASDPRQGCMESVYALCDDPTFYHNPKCCGGILEQECKQLLQSFFKEKRP